ncbi:MAG: adenylate/guanylate cyclase domain-containing protein [Candidatus Limnocylindria bacterium]
MVALPDVDLPTGTVTFLFTDVEGSTRLLQALGRAFPSVLERHHRILRDAIARHRGREVSTEGDAFFVVFRSAPDAVAAATDAQRALTAEAWPEGTALRVRMGIHTGEAVIGADNYVGLDVHRAARINAAGHGGQVLLSDSTRALVDAALPDGVRMRDLGEHRLKDLARPERLHQLVIEGLEGEFGTLRSLDAVPNNLPTQLTSFLGRRAELAEIADLLAGARLLTLTGPGGTGKTRLSLQAAAEAAHTFPGGVFFVPLAPITDPELVAPTILRSMGVREFAGAPPEERLIEELGDRLVLLVLDNLEQVLGAGPLIGRILQAAPNLKALASSRAPLRVYGEREYPVPPLGLPDPDDEATVASLSHYEAVTLFVERAVAIKPDFALTDANAPAVAEIVRRLDGLPLAIELAAARIKLLPPKAMLARLETRLSLLESGARDLPPRQRTLRGAIAWSHDLLDAAGRRLLARLSAFLGGATLDAADAVCGPVDELGTDVLDGLGTLVDQSLVRQDEIEDEPRFAMLETIREFAHERLVESGEAERVLKRHAEHFLALAEQAEPFLTRRDQKPWLDRLEREHDNLRAALSFLIERHDAPAARRLAASLWRFWQIRGHLREGRERLTAVLAVGTDDEDPRSLSRALEAAGGIAYWQGDFDAARAWYERSLALEREHGERRGMANALYNLSFVYSIPGTNTPAGRELIEESVAIYRELGETAGMAKAIWGLGNSLLAEQEYRPALDAFKESLALARAGDDRFALGWSLFMVGGTSYQLDDVLGAREHFRQALELFAESGDMSGVVLLLGAFSELAYFAGDLERAGRLAGASLALEARTGTTLAGISGLRIGMKPREEVRREEPEAFAAGEAMTVDEAVAYALATPPPPGAPVPA